MRNKMKSLIKYLPIIYTTIIHLTTVPAHPIDNPVQYIVGGQPAAPNQAPWQTWIGFKQGLEYVDNATHARTRFIESGGALVGKRAVLTAAHVCTDIYNNPEVMQMKRPENFLVEYGGNDNTRLSHTNNVTKIILHPLLNTTNMENDICVLILEDEVKESANVQIISIADRIPVPGTKADLSGWGMISTYPEIKHITDRFPIDLQHITMAIIDYKTCNDQYSNHKSKYGMDAISTKVFCAESTTNSSACHGDSGGSLVVNKQIIGVVSMANPKCDLAKGWPVIFSNAVLVKSWIEKQIALNAHKGSDETIM